MASATGNLTTSTLASVKSCTRSPFLDLPRELRQMILKYCVAQGRVFPDPQPALDSRYDGWEEYGKPSLQLLRVSCQIAKETKEMFYLHNLAVIPRGMECWSECWSKSKITPPSLKMWMLPPFRALSITFSNGDMSVAARLNYERAGRKDFENNFYRSAIPEQGTSIVREPGRGRYERSIHQELSDELVDGFWFQKARLISKRLDLDTLEIDYTDAYCTSGCCRMAKEATLLFGCFTFGLPNSIIVQGARSADEKAEILQLIRDGYYELYSDGLSSWDEDEEMSAASGGQADSARERENDSEMDLHWDSDKDEEVNSEEPMNSEKVMQSEEETNSEEEEEEMGSDKGEDFSSEKNKY
ncbi:MAG: hypothetical protein M1830_008212 [Pleopsidium flavum]|nr:MAG: hypothetical protein M1830_008212 [Pleopsidium flavum]